MSDRHKIKTKGRKNTKLSSDEKIEKVFDLLLMKKSKTSSIYGASEDDEDSKNILVESGSDQSKCEDKPKIRLNIPSLAFSTPCQKSAKHTISLYQISPIPKPSDSFNKKCSNIYNQSSVIISSPLSDCEKNHISMNSNPKERVNNVHSNNSIKTSPLLFDSYCDTSTNPISNSFYQQSTRELKYFSPEKHSKTDSIKKLKSLINEAEMSIKNQKTVTQYSNEISQTDKNTSTFEKSARNLDYVTKRRSVKIQNVSENDFNVLEPDRYNYNSINDSSLFNTSKIQNSVPRKSMYCAGKKWRRSINYINQMKKLSMMNVMPEAMTNNEGIDYVLYISFAYIYLNIFFNLF